MNESRITKWAIVASVISTLAAIVAVAALIGVLNQPVVKGVTNFDSLALSQDLIVGDDASIGGDLLVEGSSTQSGTAAFSGTVTLTAIIVEGSSTLSGTVASSSTVTCAGLTVSGTATVSDTITTNYLDVLSNAVITGTCNVSGTANFSSTVQYGVSNLYPLGFAVSTGRGYGGIATGVTNTTILSTSHGCQNGITTALCMVAVPSTTVGSPYLCSYSVSSLDITFQAVQTSTAVATTTGTLLYWIIGW